MQGDNWQLGAVAIVLSSILAGCSLVSYYAILVDISTEDERDRVSSRGWAFGYLGGGLLLAGQPRRSFLGHDAIGLDEEHGGAASRCSRPRCGGPAFTIIPFLRLRNRAPRRRRARSPAACCSAASASSSTTLKELRSYPMTLTFLVAYLFYNDGIQTVIYAASTYGSKQLGSADSVLIATILLIQFVAFGGALFFGRLAGAVRRLPRDPVGHLRLDGDRRGRDVPARRRTSRCSSLVGVAIGIVLGGTQALSRSFFSLLIPRGREGEYFALYNACERGTSWFGTLLFGVVFQVTGSYRPAIVALIVFFVLGAFFLLRLDPRARHRGGRATPCPAVV